MMQTIRPAKNQLFCKPIEHETKTSSGLLLANKGEKPNVAEIINIGGEVKQFKSKEHIIYKSYTTTDISIENQHFFLISEDDVLGVVIEVSEPAKQRA